jgi:hypothetical protein
LHFFSGEIVICGAFGLSGRFAPFIILRFIVATVYSGIIIYGVRSVFAATRMARIFSAIGLFGTTAACHLSAALASSFKRQQVGVPV